MIDFQINDKGDLVIEEAMPTSIFKLDFRISENSDFKLMFHIGEQRDFVSDAQFKISFDIGKEEKRSKIETVQDEEMKIQKIRMALMTERGELSSFARFGSRLFLFKNDNLFSDETMRRIEDSVKESIAHISKDAVVKAKPEIGTGNFYAQTVGVYIYENSRLIYRFRL